MEPSLEAAPVTEERLVRDFDLLVVAGAGADHDPPLDETLDHRRDFLAACEAGADDRGHDAGDAAAPTQRHLDAFVDDRQFHHQALAGIEQSAPGEFVAIAFRNRSERGLERRQPRVSHLVDVVEWLSGFRLSWPHVPQALQGELQQRKAAGRIGRCAGEPLDDGGRQEPQADRVCRLLDGTTNLGHRHGRQGLGRRITREHQEQRVAIP